MLYINLQLIIRDKQFVLSIWDVLTKLYKTLSVRSFNEAFI